MKAIAGRLLAGMTALLAVPCLLGLAGRWHWLADLSVHFVPHYLAAGALLFPGLVLTGRRRWAILAAAIVLWNAWLLSPYFLPLKESRAPGGASVELLQLNISRDNPVPIAAIGYILSLERPPDVVVLMETTPSLAAYVKRLNQVYPTIAQMPRSDNFGMAVLSRLPDSEVAFRVAKGVPVPSMMLKARVGRHTIRIYAAHPPPPLGARFARARNDQLRQLADEIARDAGDHVVVAGDLNTSIWSHAFSPLVKIAGLRDAQAGRGYLPTWSPPPCARWVGLAIDHTLVSENIEVQSRYVGPSLASDHWPVHTRLSLP